MNADTYTVTLPDNSKLSFQRTGKMMKVRDIPPASCFLHCGEVWERLPGSSGNLSNFGNEGFVLELTTVELLKEL